MIDRAHAIAASPDVIFTSFGDMLRVPGSHGDLLRLRSRGADVRVVYSPLDAVADRKSTRLNSSHMSISYAVFCLKKKKDSRSSCSIVLMVVRGLRAELPRVAELALPSH